MAIGCGLKIHHIYAILASGKKYINTIFHETTFYENTVKIEFKIYF
jgi:hypothetical protein